MKKNKLNLKIFFCFIALFVFTLSCKQSTEKTDNTKDARHLQETENINLKNEQRAENYFNKPCSDLKTFLNEEIIKKGKLSSDSSIIYIASKSRIEAFNQAQATCIRLNSELAEKNDSLIIFLLPKDLGELNIFDTERKDSYITLSMKLRCTNILTKEIQYISLRKYNDLK